VPTKVAPASAADRCEARQLPAFVQGLSSHTIQLFAGVDALAVRELIDAAPGSALTRPVLFLSLSKASTTEAIIAGVIDQLAAAATALWPLWFGGEDFSELNDGALSHRYLPIKLAMLTSPLPHLSTGWAEAAIRRLLRGRTPRVPGAGAETEWSQFCYTISPSGLIAVVPLDEACSQDPWAVVRALEWLAANSDVAIAVLCRALPPHEPPFDRLLYGARVVTSDILLATHVENADCKEAIEAPPLALLLPSVQGRPHPQSLIEKRLSTMIAADAELTSKFIFNAIVEDVSLKSPKVDLLWAEGRLVIELDGAEHRGRRAYRDDRHRDYELLCAGYLVVRITNDEILEDFERALEKIRSIVRLRRLSVGEGR
jgi:very-short-patch-repair endonuclease